VQWHAAYDDPATSLTQRLATVVAMICEHADAAPPGPIRVLSLCAGDCRDLTEAMVGHPRRRDVTGAVVELVPVLAERARVRIAAAGLDLSVVVGDAGDTALLSGFLPVDLLVLVGIFGNIADADVEQTIRCVPALCSADATVIWTRHRREPDLTPAIIRWLEDAGCEALQFESPGPGGHAVGRCRVQRADRTATLPPSLFAFRNDLW
jgi:hypothetical protein